MRSLFDNLAIVHNYDAVGILHSGKSMGYYQHGFSLGEMCQCFTDKLFVFGVGKGGRLIEYDDRSVFQNGTGKDNTLLLTSRKIGTFGTDNGIYSLW